MHGPIIVWENIILVCPGLLHFKNGLLAFYYHLSLCNSHNVRLPK